MNFIRYCLVIMACCCTCTSVFAQTITTDTAFVQASVSSAIQSYRRAIGNMAHLYSGQEYVDYRILNRDGHQYFLTDEFSTGKVVFDGTLYENITMAYDLVRDELIIRKRANSLTQRLTPEKVSSFEIHGHAFVRYTLDSLATSGLAVGNYDVLFKDKMMLIARRKKTVEEKPESLKVLQIFKDYNQYYILKDNKYHQIQHKRNVYKVFKDRKKDLQRFAREQKLNFRHQQEAAFIDLVTYYNSLLP